MRSCDNWLEKHIIMLSLLISVIKEYLKKKSLFLQDIRQKIVDCHWNRERSKKMIVVRLIDYLEANRYNELSRADGKTVDRSGICIIHLER